MTTPERGKLIPVSGENDEPDMENAIDVQFNPVTLKVTLSNTLKDGEKNGSSNAAQFVEKSSSSLSLDLMFDTTRADKDNDDGFAEGADVRDLTKKIAEAFMKPVPGDNNKMQAPKRCLFQWGSFEFIGMVESYDETLEFFSPQGRPLRAKLALKLKEDRFQFRQRSGFDPAAPVMPDFAPTGQTDDDAGGKASQEETPVPGPSEGDNNWRDTSDFNGIENPRIPGVSTLSKPRPGCRSGGGLSAGVSTGLGASVSMKAAASLSASASLNANLNTGLSATLAAGINAGLSLGLTTGLSVSAGGSTTASSAVNVPPVTGPVYSTGVSISPGINPDAGRLPDRDSGVGFE